MSPTGSDLGFRNWVPKIGNCKMLGIQIFKGDHDIPYYPAYTPHFYTVQHLCQGGGACYQRVQEPELFHIDAKGVGQG